jgi:HAD superfamily hydrolase (TIGR01490 family)
MSVRIRKKLRKVAVFDIDGTVFRSSLLIELVEELIGAGIFPTKARRMYAVHFRRWLDRKGSYEAYINAVVRAFETHIKGVKRRDFLRVARRVVTGRKDRVYRYTRDLIKTLKRKGYYLLAVSHSPKYVVENFAKRLGFDKVYGHMFEIDTRGRFTGVIMHKELIRDKAKVVQRAIEKEHLTLKGSIGVGDTESDIPLLRSVAAPICFNPNRALYGAARRNGWKVVVERKDMIYELNI